MLEKKLHANLDKPLSELIKSGDKIDFTDPMLNGVSVYDERASDVDTYFYPDSHMPEEHLFVPASNSSPESNGWVVGTAIDYRKQQTELSVFDIRSVSDGPVYSARLPYMLPLGLHGKFVQSS